MGLPNGLCPNGPPFVPSCPFTLELCDGKWHEYRARRALKTCYLDHWRPCTKTPSTAMTQSSILTPRLSNVPMTRTLMSTGQSTLEPSLNRALVGFLKTARPRLQPFVKLRKTARGRATKLPRSMPQTLAIPTKSQPQQLLPQRQPLSSAQRKPSWFSLRVKNLMKWMSTSTMEKYRHQTCSCLTCSRATKRNMPLKRLPAKLSWQTLLGSRRLKKTASALRSGPRSRRKKRTKRRKKKPRSSASTKRRKSAWKKN
mmetsp:Transcript_37301/g.97796  ORF Transcript_37301/g.97796 Transcript_37301/m.97796 type:complete len:256 (+) Transcript_37301:730-1497(+)